MSSINALGGHNDALYAASLTPASAASSSSSAAGQVPVDTPKDSVHLSTAAFREIYQLGRVAYNQQAGNLTSTQASQLDAQIEQLQSSLTSGGSSSSSQGPSVSQLQDEISKEIYANAHGISNGGNQIVPPSISPTGSSVASS